ncbi:MAG TPA: hypothetical protein VFL38_07030 [Humibacillus xanthopallidus]|nr:hypothetical protein [Humibacillus xanthopallidus]
MKTMSQLLEKQATKTEQGLPRLFRNRTVDYTLIVVGALVAGFGAFAYFVMSNWPSGAGSSAAADNYIALGAGLAAGWYFGAWIVGGVLLAIGFGLLGASIRDRSGVWTADAVMSFVLGTLSLAGAVAAAVLLII